MIRWDPPWTLHQCVQIPLRTDEMTGRDVVSLVPKVFLDAHTYASVERLITQTVHVIPVIDIFLMVDGGDILTQASSIVCRDSCCRVSRNHALQ